MRLALSTFALAAVLGAHHAHAGSLTEVASFGANPGALDMYTYVPADLPAGRPLVVVMHGCTQTAASMQIAGWDALADQYKFAVLYPQERAANQQLSCFRWYEPAQIARGGGEPASIIAMVDTMVSAHHVDPDHVYVTGLSAGAAFTAVMMATYPERFAAGSIMSGLPYRCASDVSSAQSCEMMGAATQKSAAAWGALVTGASAGFSGAWPRVQIWQGSSDFTVYPANATELVKQWTDVHGADPTPSATDAISNATRTQYTAGGEVVVEEYVVTGMGHDVATGMDALGACPATSGAYFADEKICSTLRAAQFFGLLGADVGSGSDGGGSGDGGGGAGSGSNAEQGDDTGGCSSSGGGGGGVGLAGFALLGMLAARRRRAAGVVAGALMVVAGTADAAQTPVTSFGSNPGGLQMFVHVPASLAAGRPLVVVMHGCTQTAAAMESAGWDALADQYGFAVVYPQQTSTNNPVECFNWAGNYGNLADLTRGQGENESVIQMVDTMIAQHGSDPARVYVTGFSAGAAFTATMLATWPDRFAAGAIMSGLPYRCGTDVASALKCQSPGTPKTAAAWGALARAGDSGFAGPYPRVQLWQGSSDTTVVPANQTELIKQWTDVWGADQTADSTETIGGAVHTTYKAGATVVVDVYTVTGMDHAVALGTDALGPCPGTAGAQYFEAKNICSTLRAADFFGLLGTSGGGSGSGDGSGTTGPDTTAPQIAFETPGDGATVTGTVTVVIAASDNVGVDTVAFAVDGTAVASLSAAPFTVTWDTSAAGDGPHTLTAVAHDAAGNDATATAAITVSGGGGSGSGSDAGSNAEPGSNTDLPACSLDAGRSPRALWPIAAVLAGLVARARRRTRARRHSA